MQVGLAIEPVEVLQQQPLQCPRSLKAWLERFVWNNHLRSEILTAKTLETLHLAALDLISSTYTESTCAPSWNQETQSGQQCSDNDAGRSSVQFELPNTGYNNDQRSSDSLDIYLQ